jgi:DivIVA domain-containing protein
MWLALVAAVVLVGLAVAAVLGRVDGTLGEPTTTASYTPLPEDRLTPDDLDSLRFDTGARGYRMEQVDDAVDRLVREIADLRELLAQVPVGPLAGYAAGSGRQPDDIYHRPADVGLPTADGVQPDAMTQERQTAASGGAPQDPSAGATGA